MKKTLICLLLALALVCSAAQAALYDAVEVYEMFDSNNRSMGTQSVCYAYSADCTKSALQDWYFRYCHDSGNQWNVIIYAEDSSMGIVNCGDCIYVNAQLYMADAGANTWVMYDPTWSDLIYIGSDTTRRLRKADRDMNMYVLNTTTYRFHTVDCPLVPRMRAENTWYYTGYYDDLVLTGYAPCSRCNPY